MRHEISCPAWWSSTSGVASWPTRSPVASKRSADAIDGYADERRGVLIGLDAPLAIPNERGTRRIERILSKVSLPAYSANRNMFGDEPYAEKLLEALQENGSSTQITRSRINAASRSWWR